MTRQYPDTEADLKALRKTVRRLRLFVVVAVIYLIGQTIEFRLTFASMAESNQAALRSAARNNNLTISYESPSFIGPWGFWAVVGLVVVYAIYRGIRRWWNQGRVQA